MATDHAKTHRFSWSEAVRVIDSAPARYGPSREGSVCGMREIESESAASDLGEPVGTVLYLVEWRDGDSLEVPEQHLVAI